MSIQKINPPTLLKFDGLAQVVVAAGGGSTVYIAGQSAYTNTFELVGAGDYRAQATQAPRQPKACSKCRVKGQPTVEPKPPNNATPVIGRRAASP